MRPTIVFVNLSLKVRMSFMAKNDLSVKMLIFSIALQFKWTLKASIWRSFYKIVHKEVRCLRTLFVEKEHARFERKFSYFPIFFEATHFVNY